MFKVCVCVCHDNSSSNVQKEERQSNDKNKAKATIMVSLLGYERQRMTMGKKQLLDQNQQLHSHHFIVTIVVMRTFLSQATSSNHGFVEV